MSNHRKMWSNPFLFLSVIILSAGCSKSSSYGSGNSGPTVVKEWDVAMKTAFEVPAIPNRTETGTAILQLMSDNTMKYNITVNGLAANDTLTLSHIHWGDAVTAGSIILNFSPNFGLGGTASGQVDVRPTLADSIKQGDVYVNVHSKRFGGGLLRGQLNKPVDFAIDVPLSGADEVPAVNTTATGTAYIRLCADKTLFSKIVVANIEAGDAFTIAHIHTGAAGTAPANNILQNLCTSGADFGISKQNAVSDAIATSIKTAQVYVNAHSTNHVGGIIRGQIR